MARHVLSLEVEDTLNCTILRIEDTSIYEATMPVECPLLEITLPGFTSAVQIGETIIDPSFRINLTACELEIQSSGCGTEFENLPDGIYVIKYSVSPNDEVYVEYNHLRVSKLMNNYKKILCELDLADCDPIQETQDKLEELNLIRGYIEAAKAKVELCHEPKKGIELYTYAKKRLNKFKCSSCY